MPPRQSSLSCQTGNPINGCWRCDTNWEANSQCLADCGIGIGARALGGKGGQIYMVMDSLDNDAVNPTLGTLWFAVIQEEPLWIICFENILIKLKQGLIFNIFETLDGRGATVHIVGSGCITLQYISNVIIHNIYVHHCIPSGDTNVKSSPMHFQLLLSSL
ncbi:hypothetical protein NE237_026455 [Protea cynaroides]|uniref:Pectate lyase n=1 Tax=Protea cynaroides TaxID=273540 RepID=A0A9Q0K0H9_9MAGN|nr:hypothetical protein NE237_026455 [Protea cynaroides]